MDQSHKKDDQFPEVIYEKHLNYLANLENFC